MYVSKSTIQTFMYFIAFEKDMIQLNEDVHVLFRVSFKVEDQKKETTRVSKELILKIR